MTCSKEKKHITAILSFSPSLYIHTYRYRYRYRYTGLPGGSEVKVSACVCMQCGRPGFNSWVGNIPWRRKWQSTPIFLPGEFHGQRSLVGCSPRGCKESDMTERLHFHFHIYMSHLMQKANSLEKTLVLVRIEGKRKKGQQRMTSLDSITYLVDRNLSKFREILEGRGAWHAAVHGVIGS